MADHGFEICYINPQRDIPQSENSEKNENLLFEANQLLDHAHIILFFIRNLHLTNHCDFIIQHVNYYIFHVNMIRYSRIR